ncbi:MAG: glycosyltransferase, partial [Opitutales bacterium]
LHAARWPFRLLPALRALGCRVVAFLHDAYLYTGRCAYPGDCRLYLTGCTAACPTADQYPKLEPGLIPAAWRLRREIFGGAHGIDVVANSQWNKRMFLTALPQAHGVDTVELGADENIYCPGDKIAARLALGLPADKPVVLCAAVNFQEERKGGRHLREIVSSMGDEVHFAAFGHNASEIPGLMGLGYHLRAEKLAQIYQAADLFLGTSTEEAFGQTVMEAQLCGLPAVAFHAGGVSEIIHHGVTGLLVRNASAAAAVEAIRSLVSSPTQLAEYGRLARKLAVVRFSLPAHAERWQHYLAGHRLAGGGPKPPVLAYPLSETGSLALRDHHQPSWPAREDMLTAEHRTIVEQTTGLTGPSQPAEILKLYEMGYHAGDVILEIGPLGGRTAVTALRGAKANPARTLPPLYFGLATPPGTTGTTLAALLAAELVGHCHLLTGSVEGYFSSWDAEPTMVYLQSSGADGTLLADLKVLSRFLRPGTPVFLADYLSTAQTVTRLAADQWVGEGHARFMGCFGTSALYSTQQAVD